MVVVVTPVIEICDHVLSTCSEVHVHHVFATLFVLNDTFSMCHNESINVHNLRAHHEPQNVMTLFVFKLIF